MVALTEYSSTTSLKVTVTVTGEKRVYAPMLLVTVTVG